MKVVGHEIVTACRNMAERLARYNKDYRDAMPPIQALISGYAGPYLWESNLTGWTYANNRGLSNTLYKHRDLTKLLVANTVNFLEAL
jgi:hypothetical protein